MMPEFMSRGNVQHVNRMMVVEKPLWLKEQETLVYSELNFALFDPHKMILS